MPIYRFYHPLLHYASRVRLVDINILPRFFIFEPNARAGCCALIVLIIAKDGKQLYCLFIGEVFWQFAKTIYQFLFSPHRVFLFAKVANFLTCHGKAVNI